MQVLTNDNVPVVIPTANIARSILTDKHLNSVSPSLATVWLPLGVATLSVV